MWDENREVVARGGGSEQARDGHEDCPMCNPSEEEGDKEERDYERRGRDGAVEGRNEDEG